MFKFTDAQVAALTPIIDDAFAAYASVKSTPGIFTAAYGAVLDAISQTVGYEMGSVTIPADGIPLNVWQWVQGAQAVNQEGSGFPGFIRSYTMTQAELRTGKILSDAEVQAASNGVAFNFLTEVRDTFDGDREMISIRTIGEADAGAAASAVFSGDYAPWAGTLLFPYLGEPYFFQKLLLTNSVFDNGGNKIANSEPGTYDLIASLQTSYAATTENLIGLAGEFFSGNLPSFDASTLVAQTNAYFANSYGLNPDSTVFTPGDDLLFNNLSALFPNITYAVGQINSDVGANALTLFAGNNPIIANAGGGNDQILIDFPGVSAGTGVQYALIDGGAGLDTVSYAGSSGSGLSNSNPLSGDGVYIYFVGNAGELYSYSIVIEGQYIQHSLFGVETLIMHNDDDTLVFGDFGVTGVILDAGDNLEIGDTLDFWDVSQGITLELAEVGNGAATQVNFAETNVAVLNFENVVGSDYDDAISGNSENNIFSGNDGSDTISGGEGDDTINGGDGADELNGGAGDDRIIIDADDTVVNAGEGRDAVYVSGDADVALDMSANGVEIFVGGAGNDTVSSLMDPNELVILAGGAGNDELILEHEEFNLGDPLPDRGPVIMMGGAGADAFIGTGGAVMVINANLTEDNIANLTMNDLRAAFSQVDWLEISAVIINADSSDRFEFSEGQGAISASTGNGFFIPQYWNTRLQGQSYVFSDNLSNLDPTDPASGFFGTDRNNPDHYESGGPSGTGWTIFGASLSGTTIGASSINVVFDTEDDDILEGGELDDRFAYSGGSNTYAGGGGTNTVGYGRSGVSTVTINLATGSGTIESTSGTATDTYELIQNVSGSFGSDDITGSTVANELSGGEGADVIAGGAGNDTLFGGADNDVLTGGTGSDVFAFDAGDGDDEIADFEIENDLIVIDGQLIDPASSPFDVTVSQVGENVVISYGNDPFSSAAGDDVTLLNVSLDEWINGPATETVLGSDGNNVINQSYSDENGVSISDNGQLILGGGGRDNIYDGAGDDTVNGGDGRDRFYAGDGADTYIGGADRDEVFYSTSTSGLVIDMVNTANSTGIAAGDTYSGIEYLHGSNFDDTIIANTDLVFGRAGNDVIQDADGQQRMFGGAGSDTFRFVEGDNDRDRISDFELGVDMIDLSLWGVTSLNDAGLVIEERTSGQGNLQGDLVITFNGNSNYIRIDHLDTADIAALDASHFIFV